MIPNTVKLPSKHETPRELPHKLHGKTPRVGQEFGSNKDNATRFTLVITRLESRIKQGNGGQSVTCANQTETEPAGNHHQSLTCVEEVRVIEHGAAGNATEQHQSTKVQRSEGMTPSLPAKTSAQNSKTQVAKLAKGTQVNFQGPQRGRQRGLTATHNVTAERISKPAPNALRRLGMRDNTLPRNCHGDGVPKDYVSC
jgi:hypothetical protein